MFEPIHCEKLELSIMNNFQQPVCNFNLIDINEFNG